jgi:hypothetical protein
MGRIRARALALSQRLHENVWEQLRAGAREAAESGGRSPQADARGEEDSAALEPEAFASKRELVEETGMRPREYFLALLEAREGRSRQQELCEHTGWPSSTVSCLLRRMDERGDVVRIRLGRDKFVFLPDAVPDAGEAERGEYRGPTFEYGEDA